MSERMRVLAPRSAAGRFASYGGGLGGRRAASGGGLGGGFSRRGMLAGAGALGLGMLAGCQSSGSVATSPTPDGRLESMLNVYSWGDYDDPDVLDGWSAAHDVKLQVDAYGSNEELIAKLAAARGTSGYDIIVPTGLRVPDMAEHGLIQKLDMSLIPNLDTIDANFRGQEYDPDDEYSVCKAWGTTGFVYDTSVVTRDLTSWQDFIDVAQEEANGTTMLLEDPWEVVAIALAALGYDLNTEDAGELDEAADIVVEQLAPTARAYLGNVNTAMAQGGFVLMQAFNGDARQGMMEAEDPDRWKFVFPTPSANIWTDNWCLATGAPNPDAAHSFINHVIAPDNAFAQVDYIGYHTGSSVLAEPGIEEEFDYADIVFPKQEVLDRLVASEFNSGQARRVEIFTDAQARSGA